MKLQIERNCWRLTGAVVVLAGLAMMIWGLILGDRGYEWDRMPARITAIGAFVAVAGLAALVLARILSVLLDPEEGPRGSLWTLASYGSVITGIFCGAIEAVVWQNSVNQLQQAEWITSHQKCLFVIYAWMFLVGVIALIGQRTVSRILDVRAESARGRGAAG